MQEKETVRFIYERTGYTDSSQIVETVAFDSEIQEQDIAKTSMLLDKLQTLLGRLSIDQTVMPFVVLLNLEEQDLIPVYLEALESGDLSIVQDYIENLESEEFIPSSDTKKKEDDNELVSGLSEFVRFQRKFKEDMGFQQYVFDCLKKDGLTF